MSEKDGYDKLKDRIEESIKGGKQLKEKEIKELLKKGEEDNKKKVIK